MIAISPKYYQSVYSRWPCSLGGASTTTSSVNEIGVVRFNRTAGPIGQSVASTTGNNALVASARFGNGTLIAYYTSTTAPPTLPTSVLSTGLTGYFLVTSLEGAPLTTPVSMGGLLLSASDGMYTLADGSVVMPSLTSGTLKLTRIAPPPCTISILITFMPFY